MQFELLTQSGVKFRGQVDEAHLKLVDGEIGILPGHEDLTAIALPGPLQLHTKSKTEVFAVFGGILRVRAEVVQLLADDADAADELIEHEIEAALAKAKQLRAAAGTKHDLEKAQHLIDRHHVRLQVTRLRRPTRSGRHLH